MHYKTAPEKHDEGSKRTQKAIINAMPIYTMAHTNPALTHAISSLSRREIEVATKLLEGLPNKKIAVELYY